MKDSSQKPSAGVKTGKLFYPDRLSPTDRFFSFIISFCVASSDRDSSFGRQRHEEMNGGKCFNCGLVNFAHATMCKRCGMKAESDDGDGVRVSVVALRLLPV